MLCFVNKILISALFMLLQSCAYLHHVQVGDIDYHAKFIRVPFELKVSETGVDIAEAGAIIKGASNNSSFGDSAQTVAAIITLFQMGPRTGKPVYDEKYADNLAHVIYERCPSGNITGLVMIREMNSYPVVSGEIVKIKGYCLQEKTIRKNKGNS